MLKILARKPNKLTPPIISQTDNVWHFLCQRIKPRKVGGFFIIFVSLLSSCQPVPAFSYTNEQIAEAIFLAEGGFKAQYLYGIRSVKYNNFEEARKICLNTIKNNRRRYRDYGYKKYNTYLEFLASRYAPISGNLTEKERDLNRYWLSNVLYFLKGGD